MLYEDFLPAGVLINNYRGLKAPHFIAQAHPGHHRDWHDQEMPILNGHSTQPATPTARTCLEVRVEAQFPTVRCVYAVSARVTRTMRSVRRVRDGECEL